MLHIYVIGKQDAWLPTVRQIFREYNEQLGFDLCFQNFDEEMASLPGRYAEPDGRLYLGLVDEQPAACGAFYKLEEGICELKRLYVCPPFKGKGYARTLLERAMADAKAVGYHTMRLDSLHRLKDARKLYEKYGFYDIEPYNKNPYDDVYYMECRL